MNPPIINALRQQRNDAMDAAANHAAEAENLRQSTEQTYRMLAQIVRSDQLPHEDVQKMLMADPQFAAWYKAHTENKK